MKDTVNVRETPRYDLDQMPGLWQKLDDPYGIVWRTRNALRRIRPRCMARFAVGLTRPPRYVRPIFIIGCSRSGTSLVFQALRQSGELGSLPGEGHDLWRTFHHPRYSGWSSDAVGPGQVRFGEARFVYAFLFAHFSAARFVEKTPENSFRVPYLLDLFPDACFVVVKRNPCDVINSLINGWRHPGGRFRSYYVPEDLCIPGYPRRRQWCFSLIPNWRQLRSQPVPEICFLQWKAFMSALAGARNLIPPARWVEIVFEDLLARPEEVFADVCRSLELPRSEAMRRALHDLIRRPANALSPAGINKWREENHEELEKLLPRIASLAPLSGYSVFPDSGQVVYAGGSVAQPETFRPDPG